MNTRRVLFGSVGVMIVVWAVTILAWRDAPFALTFDDAWYYFTIARNVADGAGSTFDGINPTNGYHPLWLMMCVPVFALGLDDMAAARALLVIQLAMWGAAMLLVADIVARAVDSWPRISKSDTKSRRWCTATVVTTFVLLAGNPFMVKVFVNGLESGVAVLAYAGLLFVTIRKGRYWITDTTDRWRLAVGVLLAFTFLARTDAIFAIATLGLMCIVEVWPLRLQHVRAMGELFGPAAVTIAAYLVFNQVRFDSAVQISGLVKRAQPNATMIIGLTLTAVIALAIGAAAFRRERHDPRVKPRRFDRTVDLVARTGWFASFCVLIIGYYSFAQVQQWLWYYAPVVLYLILLGVVGVADFVEAAVLEAPAGRTPVRALTPIMAILIAPLVGAFAFQAHSFADPNLRSIQIANRTAGEWININLPDDAVLASWDAGVVGYFSHRSIINLDGVVNSVEYDRARRTAATGTFLSDRGLGWIVNHGHPVEGQDREIIRFVDDVFGKEVGSELTLVESWPFTFSGTTGGSGFADESGTRDMAVFLYRLPTPPAPSTRE